MTNIILFAIQTFLFPMNYLKMIATKGLLLGDPTKIPTGAHCYPSFRYGRGGYRGGRLNFRCPESRRGGDGRGGRNHLLFHQRNPGYTPVPKRRNYLSPNHKFHY
jgi:hypothetical protein